MGQIYPLTPNEVAVLRVLNEGIVEMSDAEVAVRSLLIPIEARTALARLEQHGLAGSWIPITGRTGEHLHVVTDVGRAIYRALASFEGTPPVGTKVPLRTVPGYSEWFSRGCPSFVEIVPEEREPVRR